MKGMTKGALIALSVAALFGARGALADSDMKAMDGGKSRVRMVCGV